MALSPHVTTPLPRGRSRPLSPAGPLPPARRRHHLPEPGQLWDRRPSRCPSESVHPTAPGDRGPAWPAGVLQPPFPERHRDPLCCVAPPSLPRPLLGFELAARGGAGTAGKGWPPRSLGFPAFRSPSGSSEAGSCTLRCWAALPTPVQPVPPAPASAWPGDPRLGLPGGRGATEANYRGFQTRGQWKPEQPVFTQQCPQQPHCRQALAPTGRGWITKMWSTHSGAT